ncbi:MAG: cysteine-rich CWC family protein [Gammaproteobacteria bacterium]|nr:cysteine-rich CWC family protein [Gammaproteobacteria bacterium]
MPEHEKKQCPRCQQGFECKSGSILLCQCAGVELSAEQLEFTSTRYDDCLCAACLLELRTEFNALSHYETIQAILSGRCLPPKK